MTRTTEQPFRVYISAPYVDRDVVPDLTPQQGALRVMIDDVMRGSTDDGLPIEVTSIFNRPASRPYQPQIADIADSGGPTQGLMLLPRWPEMVIVGDNESWPRIAALRRSGIVVATYGMRMGSSYGYRLEELGISLDIWREPDPRVDARFDLDYASRAYWPLREALIPRNDLYALTESYEKVLESRRSAVAQAIKAARKVPGYWELMDTRTQDFGVYVQPNDPIDPGRPIREMLGCGRLLRAIRARDAVGARSAISGIRSLVRPTGFLETALRTPWIPPSE